jgi:tetratricopeptide (TPR) repeat protein
MKRTSILIALIGVALAAGGVGAVWWARAGGQQTVVAAALPLEPDLGAAPAPLRERLVAAQAKARSRLHAKGGLEELSRLYHANGFLSEAMRCYAGLEQLEPSQPRFLHLHATILAGYGEIEPALALWRRVIELAPDYLPARLRIGDAELKSNHVEQATAAYNEVLRRKPNEPYALLGLARLDLEAGRFEKARERLEAVVAQTNFNLGYDLIVSLYERMGQPERAAAIRGANKASGAYRDPADPWLDALLEECFDPYRLSLAAGSLARNGEPASAIRLLERAIELSPDDVSTRFQLGMLSVERNDLKIAREQLERCTIVAPEFPDGWAQLSALQAKMGDSTGAERTLAAGLKNCPQSPGLHLMRARNLRAADKTVEAVAAYRRSIQLRPNEPDAYVELGNALIGLGRTEEGVAEIRRAYETDPGNPMVLSVLAFNAISTANEAEARRWLSRIADQPRVPRDQLAQLAAAYRQAFKREWR